MMVMIPVFCPPKYAFPVIRRQTKRIVGGRNTAPNREVERL